MSEIQSCFKRYEKKYLLTHAQYENVKLGMAAYMRPDEHPFYSISNIYYDTDSYDIIRASLDKPVYKEKLRMRSYGTPSSGDAVFVEIKKKYDGVVYKRRITMAMMEAAEYLDEKGHGDGSQISREIDYFLQYYRPVPKVFIAYEREAYAAREGSDVRITFDTDLRARSVDVDLRLGDYGDFLLDEDQYLMEIKIPGAAPLWLARLLSENRIFPISFSKNGMYYKKYIAGKEKEASFYA